MVADLVEGSVRPGADSAPYEHVRIVYEDLDSNGSAPSRRRTEESHLSWLGKEKRRILDPQSNDGAEVPQLSGAERARVPLGGTACLLDGEHERNLYGQRRRLWRNQHYPEPSIKVIRF